MSFEKNQWVHLTAIGGTGMGALASLLLDQGFIVTGSDGPLYPPMSTFLAAKKIQIVEGYKTENVLPSNWGLEEKFKFPNLVIIGNAISRNNLEAIAVEELVAQGKTKKMSFAQAMAHFAIENKESFVVAGTHGKTTTTSLMAWALESLNLHPSFFIGGIPKNFQEGSRNTHSSVFVSEGDEYDTAYWDKESKFLHYRPTWVLCTGIEFDHADIFDSVEAIENSFIKLLKMTEKSWVLVDKVSAPRASSVERVAKAGIEFSKKIIRYGEDTNSQYQLVSVTPEKVSSNDGVVRMASKITCVLKNLGEQSFISPMLGKHNALNILGVIATLMEAQKMKTAQEIQTFLDGFLGIKRRQEEVSAKKSFVVMDDFAHHPTAIRETISAIKMKYPDRKILAFFEPRSATSARNVMFEEFAACFDEASATFLLSPSKTNVPEDQKLKIELLVNNILQREAQKGKIVCFAPTVDELNQMAGDYLNSHSEPAVALVMSNGAFGGIHQKLGTWRK